MEPSDRTRGKDPLGAPDGRELRVEKIVDLRAGQPHQADREPPGIRRLETIAQRWTPDPEDREAGLVSRSVVSQSVKVSQYASLTPVGPIVEGQDDLQTLKCGDTESSSQCLPRRRNAGLAPDGLVQPLGEHAEDLALVGRGLDHGDSPCGTSGLGERPAQHDRLAETRLRAEDHIPPPLLDRVQQAKQGLIVRRQRDVGRIVVVEGLSSQPPVLLPHVHGPPRGIVDRLVRFPSSHRVLPLDRIGWDAIFAQTWRRGVPARFYCPDPPQDGRLRLSPEESRHLSRVCRLGEGDRVEVFDGRGFASSARVVAVRPRCAELAIEGEPIPEHRAPCSLTLATSVPKGDRFDWLIEKSTEVGVDRLIPLVTDRSVVDPRVTKLGRLRRSIIEASKQCRRARLMVLEEPVTWATLVGSFPESLRFLADSDGSLPSRWPSIPRGASVVLAVGPEGGLTASERELADRCGWTAMTFGVNTLRIETAGLAGCAALFTRVTETEK
jgi:16S rRNA (uracil1498-N3)-methyltransferase